MNTSQRKPFTVWVTRPGLVGQAWVQALQQAGFDARSQALLALSAIPDVETVRASWQNLNNYAAIMFVSAAAVQYFFQAQAAPTSSQNTAQPWSAYPHFSQLRFWTPGEGTRQALLQQGVLASQIDSPNPEDGRFDSEALWEVVENQVPFFQTTNAKQAQPVKKYLLVRGASIQGQAQGREYLASRLEQRGAQWESLLVYQRQTVAPTTPLRTGVWLLSSSLSLQALEPGCWGKAIALCTHPRIADAAQQWGFAQTIQTQPQLHAIAAELRRITKTYCPQ